MTNARDPYYRPSTIKIVQRIPKTDEHPHGVRAISHINLNRPALILMGGDNTLNKRNANYYASMITDILHTNNVTDIDLYSVYYNHGDRNPGLDRADVFRRAGYRVRLATYPPDERRLESELIEQNDNEFIPRGAMRAYQIFIRPRLVTNDGKRRDMETIMKYLHRIYFWTHSYGGTMMRFLGDYMRDDMKHLGFSGRDIDAICKNILVIQHAPTAPMHRHPFTTLNFVSCSDTVVENVNHLTNYLIENAADMDAMYFNNGLGNFITVGQFNPDYKNEHNASMLRPNSYEYKSLTPDGTIVIDAERNAIVAAAKNVIAGGPIPSPQELVAGPTVDFDQMRKRGDQIYNIMLNDIRPQKQNPKHDYQK